MARVSPTRVPAKGPPPLKAPPPAELEPAASAADPFDKAQRQRAEREAAQTKAKEERKAKLELASQIEQQAHPNLEPRRQRSHRPGWLLGAALKELTPDVPTPPPDPRHNRSQAAAAASPTWRPHLPPAELGRLTNADVRAAEEARRRPATKGGINCFGLVLGVIFVISFAFFTSG